MSTDLRTLRESRTRFALQELDEARKMWAAAVKDRSYLECPLGSYVADHLRWKANERGLAKTTIRDYEITLAYLCLAFPEATPADFQPPKKGRDMLRGFMDENWGTHAPPVLKARVPAGRREPRTWNKNLSCLRGFFDWLIEEDKMEGANPANLVSRQKTRDPERQVYAEGEPELIFEAATNENERAAIAILYAFGLRKSELSGIQLRDYDGRMLTVRGKGGKIRYLPVPSPLRAILNEHWQLRLHEGTPDEYLLYPTLWGPVSFQNGEGTTKGLYREYRLRRCQSTTMHNWWKRMLAQAGVSTSRKMHEMRHTAATNLLRDSHNLPLVQQMLGHADISTTSMYTHMTQSDLAEALELLARKRAGEQDL